jgi:hypothetical protein
VKYKPRLSNFEELQDDVIEEIVEKIKENLKDAIAQAIDEYVEAIIEAHIEERSFMMWVDEGKFTIHWGMGDWLRKDGVHDIFGTETTLDDILKELDENIAMYEAKDCILAAQNIIPKLNDYIVKWQNLITKHAA